MTRKVVDGGVDGNLMVHSPFQDDHPNHINSYVENIVFGRFFVNDHGAANVGPRLLLRLSYFTLFTQISIGLILADRIITY